MSVVKGEDEAKIGMNQFREQTLKTGNQKNGIESRAIALAVLSAITSATDSLEDRFIREGADRLSASDKAFARQLVLTALRRKGQADAIIARFLHKPLPDKLTVIQHILRLGVVQLVWLHMPPHAVVDTAVTLAKQKQCIPQAGMVNAVLKKIAATPGLSGVSAETNLPIWLRDSWKKAYGKAQLTQMAESIAQEPPLDLTVKTDPQNWATTLGAAPLFGNSIRLPAGKVETLDGYEQGAWWVQDVSASLPVRMLGEVTGLHVADLCAAPGGKTAQLIASGAKVSAVDRSEVRMRRLKGNLERLGMQAACIVADLLCWEPTTSFDAILLDAPCSGTGTIRRHPEIALHKGPHDVKELAKLQAELLDRALKWLKPGGKLVYSVCSLEPEEGEEQAKALLKRHPALCVRPATSVLPELPANWQSPEGGLRTLPHYLGDQGGMDGFYALRLDVP